MRCEVLPRRRKNMKMGASCVLGGTASDRGGPARGSNHGRDNRMPSLFQARGGHASLGRRIGVFRPMRRVRAPFHHAQRPGRTIGRRRRGGVGRGDPPPAGAPTGAGFRRRSGGVHPAGAGDPRRRLAWRFAAGLARRAKRAKLTALKSEADALAARGRLGAAMTKYDEVAVQVEELHKTDPKAGALSDEIDLARRETARRIDLARAPPAPPPVAVAPPPPLPAATAPAAPAAPVVVERVRPRRGPIVPAVEPADEITDAKIDQAIRGGTTWLLAAIRPRHEPPARRSPIWPRQPRSLSRQERPVHLRADAGRAGHARRTPGRNQRIDERHDRGHEGPFDGRNHRHLCSRPSRHGAGGVQPSQGPQDTRQDVDYLLATHNNGAYDYLGPENKDGRPGPPPPGAWDNSNSQYGLLGVWSGAETGVPVPAEYWTAVESHWTANQAVNGQWGYQAARGWKAAPFR